MIACNQISYWGQRLVGTIVTYVFKSAINGFGAITATITAKILRLKSAPFHRLPVAIHGGLGDLAGRPGLRAVHFSAMLLHE